MLVELGWADPSVALVLSQHLMLHAMLADPANRWPAPVRERVQRSSLEGVALINALRVEPELGTPARGGLPATVAERLPAGGGWRLRGHKIYATGIPRLRWMAVWARTDDVEPQVGTFLVEAGTPGYRVEQTWDHLGMRATRSDDVVFEGCELPLEHAVDICPADQLGPPSPPVMAWNNLRYRRRLPRRRPSGPGLAGQLPARAGAVRVGAARWPPCPASRRRSVASRSACRPATSCWPARRPRRTVPTPAAEAAMAATALVKHTVTNNAIEVVSEAVALVGNPGLSRRNPLERHLRNVLCSRIHTPQDDTILGNAGRAALDRAANGG